MSEMNFHSRFMPRASAKLRQYPADLFSIENRFVRYVNYIRRARSRTQLYVKWVNFAICTTAILLMVVTLFNGTFTMLEDSDEIFNMADKVLTMVFVAMMFGKSKLQLVEKAYLYAVATDMLESMGTYVIECAGIYKSFDTTHDALVLFWTHFEALSQAIGLEEHAIIIRAQGQLAGMQMRLINAMERSSPEHAHLLQGAFVEDTRTTSVPASVAATGSANPSTEQPSEMPNLMMLPKPPSLTNVRTQMLQASGLQAGETTSVAISTPPAPFHHLDTSQPTINTNAHDASMHIVNPSSPTPTTQPGQHMEITPMDERVERVA